MNSYIKLTTLLLAVPAITLAQVQKQAPQTQSKKVTLEDLIKKVNQENRGSKLESNVKKSSILPSAQALFSSKENVNLKSVKPSRSSLIYSYENKDEIAYEKTLNLQINELYKMTEKFKASSTRGELWLRLGELYVEKADIINNRRQAEYDNKLKYFLAGKIKEKPLLDLSEAKDYNKKAIQLYEWFLRDFPKDPKVAQALYFLGYNNFELGNAEAGMRYYNQLNKQFPTSEYTGEAHFAIGETFFENEKWADAYKEYTFLIKTTKHHLHNMAMYKAAWCLYRIGKTDQAIKYLDYIIKTSRLVKQSNTASGKKINIIRLENEATKDLAVFFADTNDMDKALTYFKRLNSKAALESIERLGQYLSNNGNYDGARDVYKYLIDRDPLSKKSFDLQNKIVQNYFFSKNLSQFKVELYRWISVYNKKSRWFAANKDDKEMIVTSEELREATLRNYILQQHQNAQQTKSDVARQSAEESYGLYFQEFSDSKKAGEMHFFYGELLYELAHYEEASNEYLATIYKSQENSYIEKSYQNALLSLEKIIPKDEDLQKQVGESVAQVEFDKNTAKFVEVSTEYLKKYPSSEKAAEIRFRVGRLSYLTNHFELAEKNFKEIIQNHSGTKYLEYSTNLLMDMYSLRKDYEGLEKVGSELLANSAILKSKIVDEVRSVLEKSSFKLAQNLELEKKYNESAKQFILFATKYPNSTLLTTAFYNAAINFERAGKSKEAIEGYKRVLSNKTPAAANLRLTSKRLLANIYQESGAFSEAAQLFLELSKENESDPLRTNYLYNAAVMYEAINQKYRAIDLYNNYLKVNKNNKENAEIKFKLGQLYLDQKRIKDAIGIYTEYLTLPGTSIIKKIEAQYKIFDLKSKSRVKVNLAEYETKIKSLILAVSPDQKSQVSPYLAKINLLQAQGTYDQLKVVTIPANPRRQKAAIDKKLELMNKLNQQLSDIIKLDSGEEIIGALYLIGLANEHMADSFNAVPIPAGLNDDQKKLYLAEVGKITSPFITKSDEGYRSAIEKGQELQIYNVAYAEAYHKLNKKSPQTYYYSGELSDENRIIDWLKE